LSEYRPRRPWVAMHRIRGIGPLLWESRLLTWMLRLGVRVEAEEHVRLVVWAEAEVEAGLELPLRVAKEELKAELKAVEAEAEARDSTVERLVELGEAEAAVRREMMRHSHGDSVVAALVGLKAQSFLVLREVVGEQVQEAEEAVPRESETVC